MSTKGTSEQLPCPHCGNIIHNLFEVNEGVIAPGDVIVCDYCENEVLILSVREITIVIAGTLDE